MSPFVQLDDQIANHPKILKAGPEAAWLWVCAITYCQNHLTDGVVTRETLHTMPGFKPGHQQRLAERLVQAVKPGGQHGLLERHGDDYVVHDYLDRNPSRDVVLERRRKATERKARERDKIDASQRDGRVTPNVTDSVTHA
jgi:hypothetical protein